MTYAYVPAFYDLGPAAGPRLAVLWHMAEGGGTVGFLSRANRNRVSVHFVIEYSGRVVQMLQLDHMHTSIRTTAIRLTDDADGFYGRSVAVDCLGAWADVRTTLGPNHATIAVEMEGFAATGPNADQASSMHALAAYLGIPANLAHRDFASYKACPGHKVPWSVVGGHGHTDTVGGDVAINTRGLVMSSDHAINLPAGTAIYEQAGPGAPILGRIGGTQPYFGSPGPGWKAVRVDLGGGSLIGYTTTAATPYLIDSPPPGSATYTVTVGGKEAGSVTLP